MAKKPVSGKPAKKKKATSGASAQPDRETVLDLAVDAMMKLAGQLGWRGLTQADIAAEAGLELSQLNRFAASRNDLLAHFMRRIDSIVVENGPDADLTEPVKDRLFDIVMQRFDALQPWRDAIRAIARDMPFDPVSALCLGCNRHRSTIRMLAKAGVSTAGLKGRIRAAGLDVITLSTVRVWLNDDSQDMSVTMAHLDRQLSRADKLVRSLRGGGTDQDVPPNAG